MGQLHASLVQAGLPEVYAGVMLDIKHKFARGGFDIITGDVARLAGRSPQRLEDPLVHALAS